MTTLKLADKYYGLVRYGYKTQTIRKGRRDIRLGDAHLQFEHFDPIPIYITQITYKRLGHVTEEEAKLDGFRNTTELIQDLRQFYPDLDPHADEVTLIKFIV